MADYKDPENTILMELKDGTVVIELLHDIAPKHCERMKELARSGQYDGVVFHRVIERGRRTRIRPTASSSSTLPTTTS